MKHRCVHFASRASVTTSQLFAYPQFVQIDHGVRQEIVAADMGFGGTWQSRTPPPRTEYYTHYLWRAVAGSIRPEARLVLRGRELRLHGAVRAPINRLLLGAESNHATRLGNDSRQR